MDDGFKYLAKMAALIVAFFGLMHVGWSATVAAYANFYYQTRIYDVSRFGVGRDYPLLVSAYVGSHVRPDVVTAIGSSFTFGYAFDEQYTFTAALNRANIPSVNVSAIGYGISGIIDTICDIKNRDLRVRNLVIEIPLINELGWLLGGPGSPKIEPNCKRIEPQSLFWIVLNRFKGVGWARFLFDPYRGSAPYERPHVIGKVPEGYFVNASQFEKLKPLLTHNLDALFATAKGSAENVIFFVTPVYMSGVAVAGGDATAVRSQFEFAESFCKEAGRNCVDASKLIENPDNFSNITHFNGTGGKALADLIAPRIMRR